jgi:hypothetical protein
MAKIIGNEEKLAELILYISEKCATDPTFGATKLNKILCFSDFLYYAYNDRSITGVEYQKLAAGPAPRRLLPVRDKLIAEGALAVQEIPLRSGRTQKRTVNLRRPRLDILKGDEVAMVDSVIESLREVDAETASAWSHEMVGWLVTEVGETIPYSTVYFANPPLTMADRYRAREIKALKDAKPPAHKASRPHDAAARA